MQGAASTGGATSTFLHHYTTTLLHDYATTLLHYYTTTLRILIRILNYCCKLPRVTSHAVRGDRRRKRTIIAALPEGGTGQRKAAPARTVSQSRVRAVARMEEGQECVTSCVVSCGSLIFGRSGPAGGRAGRRMAAPNVLVQEGCTERVRHDCGRRRARSRARLGKRAADLCDRIAWRSILAT